ncbi:DUF397 domain-containing protein [Micromonospora chersina]|uniref:DUF397 domain-containing protein n=1 Tax=Micromonospora chersina TaxID=47854 RepID=UPI00371A2A80
MRVARRAASVGVARSAGQGQSRPQACGGNGGDCVEVADNLAGVVAVRDSKDPAGPVLTFDPAAWTRFVETTRRG